MSPYEREIEKVRRGIKVRPPRRWFYAMLKIVRKRYPKFSLRRQLRITSGIWHRMSAKAKIGIMQRLARGQNGIPTNFLKKSLGGKSRKRVVSKKAVLAALRSPRTPERLKAGLRRFAHKRGWVA